MKNIKSLSFLIAAVLATTGVSMAGETSCCGIKSAKAESACEDVTAKMDLTDEQKTKLSDLKATCAKGGCTEESRAEFLKGAEEILSTEQLAELKEACASATPAPQS